MAQLQTTAVTGSLTVTQGITGSLFGTASWASNALNAITSSYILNAVSASFATQAANASSASYATFANTASSADNFNVRGTLTATTIVVQTITSSQSWVTGSTKFGSINSNTHEFTGSVSISGSSTFGLNVNNNALYVNANGSVGIGTTSLSFPFEVRRSGNAAIRITDNANSNSLVLQGGAGSDMKITGYNYATATAIPLYISIDGANTIMQSGGGSVGIGTTSPSSPLHVSKAGNTAGGTILMGVSTTSDKWSYLVSTQYNSSTYPQGFSLIGGFTTATSNVVVIGGSIYEANPATEIQFWTYTSVSHNLGGSRRMTINSDGNVGIGTTTPSQLLDVNGKIRLRDGGNTTVPSIQMNAGGTMGFSNPSNEDISIITASTTKVFIKQDGNVGIGTTAPSEKLQVSGSRARFGNIVVGSGTYFNEIAPIDDQNLNINASGSLYFNPGNTTSLFASSTGNVGIGTLTPASLLHVNGNTTIGYSTATSAPSNGLLVSGSVGIGTTSPGIYKLYVKGGSGSQIKIEGGEADLWLTSTGGGAGTWRILGSTGEAIKLFRIYDNDNGADRFNIKADGNVGISTANPASTLHVNGNTTIGYSSATAAPSSGLLVNGSVGIGTTSPAYKLEVYENKSRFYNVVIGGTASGTYAAYSDSVVGIGNLHLVTTAGAVYINSAIALPTYINPVGGSVGIGTTTLSNKLEVDGGSSAVSLRISTTNTGTGVATLILANSSKSAFNDGVKISHGSGYTNITDLNGSSLMVWDMSNARVGIGTTLPSQKLEVVGIIKASGVSNSFMFENRSAAGNTWEWYSQGSVGSSFAGLYKNYNTAGTVLAVKDDGNVGIGTTLPAYKLEVIGTVGFSSNVIISGSKIGNENSVTGASFGTTTISNTSALTGVAIGRYLTDYAFIDIAAQNSQGGWIDFSSGSGDDYQGRIRYVNNLQRMDFYTSASGTPLMTIGGSNVGIGTINPTPHNGSNALIVRGGSGGRGIIELWDGTSGKSVFQNVSGDTYIGQLDKGTGSGRTFLLVNGNGSSADIAMVLLANGSVGIGTTLPLAKLDVVGQGMFQGSTSSSTRGANVGALNINNNTADGTVDFTQGLVFTDNNGNQGAWTHAGIVSVGSSGYNGNLVFGTDGDSTQNTTGITEKMRITSGGNVGIGTITPETIFHVAKNNAGGEGGYLYLDNNSTTTAGSSIGIRFSGDAGASFASPNAAIDVALGAAAATSMQFKTYDGAVYTERMRIHTNGNVGIKTTNPVSTLTVQGDININYNSTDTNYVQRTFATAHAAGNRGAIVRFGMDDGSFTGMSVENVASSNPSYNSQYIDFKTHEGAVFAGTVMRINPVGNVGIGTTTVLAKFQVKTGTNNNIHIFDDSGIGIQSVNDVNTVYRPLSLYASTFIFNNGNVGIGTTNPGYKLTVGGVNGNQIKLEASSGPSDYYVLISANYNYAEAFTLRVKGGGNQQDIIQWGDGSGLYINARNSNPLLLQNGGGNVGIGTTAPERKFVIVGPSSSPADQSGTLVITDGTGANTDHKLQFGILSNTYAWIQSVKPGTDNKPLLINPSGGNVGIGVTNPTGSFHVAGSTTTLGSMQIVATVSGGPAAAVTFKPVNAGSVNTSYIFELNPAGGAYGYFAVNNVDSGINQSLLQLAAYGLSGDSYINVPQTSQNFSLRVNTSTKFYLQGSSGNVGINTTNPTQKLHVVGPARASNIAIGTGTYGNVIQAIDDTNLNISASSGIYFVNNATATVIINSNGNVGVGTMLPDQLLRLNGTFGQAATSGTTQNGILRVSAYYGGGSSGWGETLDVGMHVGISGPASYAWLQSTNWSNLSVSYNLALNPRGGNVGVGTTTPLYRFHVSGSAALLKVDSISATFANPSINLFQGAIDTVISATNNGLELGTYSAHPVIFRVSNTTEAMRITSGGNIGIGTTSMWNNEILSIQRSTAGTVSTVPAILRLTNQGSGKIPKLLMTDSAIIDGIICMVPVNSTDSYFSFGFAGYTESGLVVRSNGSVGVNITSPSEKLHVYNSSTFSNILLENGTNSSYALYQAKNANSSLWQWGVWTNNTYRLGISGVGDFITVDTSGNVGIGSTAPVYKLDVGGTSKISGQFIQGAGAARSTSGTTIVQTFNHAFSANTDIGDTYRFLSIVNESTTTNAYSNVCFRVNPGAGGGGTNAMLDMKFVNANSGNASTLYWTFLSGGSFYDRMSLTSAGVLTVASDIIAYGSPSDITLKTNIKPLEGALEKITKLQGVSFTWKDNTEANQMTGIKDDIGFIAQDVQKIIPELVRKNDDTGLLSLRDKGITALLVEAIKEQQRQIDDLKYLLQTQNK